MKKVLKIAMVLLSMFFIFSGYNARADDKKIYTIKFSVNSDADLENRDINILFEYEDKNTALITLKASDEYKREQVMLEGKTIVKQVDIIGNIGQYECSYDKELDITGDKEFILTVNAKELESIGEEVEKDTTIVDNSNIKEEEEKDNEDIKEDDSTIETNGYKNSLKNSGNKILNTVVSTSVAIIIVVVIFFLYKWKRGVK
ncbi:hypothetical protein [Clostridium celatum]|uniref:hypothetical protein n=1 Tax=Clostridium celatum TaxID=36834 RepID=UPI00319EAD5D